MNHSEITLEETFFVHFDESVFSQLNYFLDAMKTAMDVANVFPQSKVEIVTSNDITRMTASA